MKRRETFKVEDNNFVFHVDGKPLNYDTIQLNYCKIQRKVGQKYSGTHMLWHGKAKLARRVGGGLHSVIAMTRDFHKEISNKIQNEILSKSIVQLPKT